MEMLYLSLWTFVHLLTFSEAFFSPDDCLITQTFMCILFMSEYIATFPALPWQDTITIQI